MRKYLTIEFYIQLENNDGLQLPTVMEWTYRKGSCSVTGLLVWSLMYLWLCLDVVHVLCKFWVGHTNPSIFWSNSEKSYTEMLSNLANLVLQIINLFCTTPTTQRWYIMPRKKKESINTFFIAYGGNSNCPAAHKYTYSIPYNKLISK